MDPLVRRFVLKYRVKKLNCSVIHQCALFIGFLKRNGVSNAVMKKGFCVCAAAACRHYWVEVDGNRIDISREISKFHTPELEYIPVVIQETIADDVKRIDLEDPKIVEEHERLFELWEESPTNFWKESPKRLSI